MRHLADVARRANGHRATKRIAALIAAGPAPTYSGHEDVLLDLVLDAGFEHPNVNERLVVGATPYYPDMRRPAQRVILEGDSPWHEGRLAQQADASARRAWRAPVTVSRARRSSRRSCTRASSWNGSSRPARRATAVRYPRPTLHRGP